MLDNYVQLLDGIPKRLHFTEHAVGDRLVADPLLGIDKRISVLTLVVDQEDGLNVSKTLSVTASGLAAQLEPYLRDRAYRAFTITITRRGSGFATRYMVGASPR